MKWIEVPVTGGNVRGVVVGGQAVLYVKIGEDPAESEKDVDWPGTVGGWCWMRRPEAHSRRCWTHGFLSGYAVT
ncbi:MAG: hypothetical protein LBJ02_01900 [Bifidobacteriaceae bacterium]|nr:hypothetical protein [Bifidobacteriaceae bacterium]